MTPVAVFLFEKSTQSAQPWADAGYLCYCVDIQHPPGEHRSGNIIRVGADISTWQLPAGPIAFLAAFPPCTDLVVSGAGHFVGKGLLRLAEAIRLFGYAVRLAEQADCPHFLENPVSTISTYWRKPDYAFDPCEYAGYLRVADQESDAYTKRTCLWAGGGFVMPERRPVFPILGSKMHRLPPSPERANLRSATPRGFARAVFLANAALAQ